MKPVTPISMTCLPDERPANREWAGMANAIEIDNWTFRNRDAAATAGITADSRTLTLGKTEIVDQSFRRTSAVGSRAADAREQASRPHHRFQQASGGNPVAKFETVGDQPLHSQMLRQGTHDVIQTLAHQDDLIAGLHACPKLFHSIGFKIWLQFVLEIFFAQQIQPVAADSAQHRVHHPGGKDCDAPRREMAATPPSAKPARGAPSVPERSAHSR